MARSELKKTRALNLGAILRNHAKKRQTRPVLGEGMQCLLGSDLIPRDDR